MANSCVFDMKIVGEQKKIETFLDYLRADYRYNHEKEIFECDEEKFLFGTEIYEPAEVSGSEVYVSGECRWSVAVSLLDQNFSYYHRYLTEQIRMHGDDTQYPATNLVHCAANLDLTFEVYSSEPGCSFQEHFIIDPTGMILEEVVVYLEYKDEETGKDVYEGGFACWNGSKFEKDGFSI